MGQLAQPRGYMDADALQVLLPMKDHLAQFEIETSMMQKVLHDLLHNDDDLDAMLLTESQKKNFRGEYDHTQIELMLENYYSQILDITQEVHYLNHRVESAQGIYELKLDTHRNFLIRVKLQLAIASVSIATGTLIAGYFGMNIESGFETDTLMFYAISSSLSITTILSYWLMSKTISFISPFRGKSKQVDPFNEVFENLDSIQKLVMYIRPSNTSEGMTKDEFFNALRPLKVSNEASQFLYQTFDSNNEEASKFNNDDASKNGFTY